MCPPNKQLVEIAQAVMEALKEGSDVNEVIDRYSKMGNSIFFSSVPSERITDTVFLQALPKKVLEIKAGGTYLGVAVLVPRMSSTMFKEMGYAAYCQSTIGRADLLLRDLTKDVNENRCLNQAFFMLSEGINDDRMHYLCV